MEAQPTMNAEKLLKLADGLENYVKDEWFSFGNWYDRNFPDQACYTVGCAWGWAPQILDDPDLKYEKDSFGNYAISYKGKARVHNHEDIIAECFDIPIGDAIDIFTNPMTYDKYWSEVTRLDVAAYIREYVTNNSDVYCDID